MTDTVTNDIAVGDRVWVDYASIADDSMPTELCGNRDGTPGPVGVVESIDSNGRRTTEVRFGAGVEPQLRGIWYTRLVHIRKVETPSEFSVGDWVQVSGDAEVADGIPVGYLGAASARVVWVEAGTNTLRVYFTNSNGSFSRGWTLQGQYATKRQGSGGFPFGTKVKYRNSYNGQLDDQIYYVVWAPARAVNTTSAPRAYVIEEHRWNNFISGGEYATGEYQTWVNSDQIEVQEWPEGYVAPGGVAAETATTPPPGYVAIEDVQKLVLEFQEKQEFCDDIWSKWVTPKLGIEKPPVPKRKVTVEFEYDPGATGYGLFGSDFNSYFLDGMRSYYSGFDNARFVSDEPITE